MQAQKSMMKINWYDGLEKNAELLLKESMWEKTFKEGSTFYNYYKNVPKGKYSTLMYYIGNKLAGVLIFPHFSLDVRTTNSKIKYCSLGEMQMYVKPEYRNQGIARKMILEFAKELQDAVEAAEESAMSRIVPIIQSVDNAFILANKILPDFFHVDVYGYSPRELMSRLNHDNDLSERLMSFVEFEKSA